MTARISKLTIKNYRSILGPLELQFPDSHPVVLMGENNVGKSNIVKALGLVLGPMWPSNHDPEDHEFFGRQRDRTIEISVQFPDHAMFGDRYSTVYWSHDPAAKGKPTSYHGLPGPWSKPTGFISNEDRATCTCMVIDAERRLDYQLSYSSKYTLLSKLMHRFHQSLLATPGAKDDLEALFEAVVDRFRQVAEFQTFSSELQSVLGDFATNMTHRLEVDFQAYNPVNFFHALRLHALEGDHPRTLEELGTGEHQILGISFAYAFAKAFHGGLVLVLEEPEAHLHPLAQQWLARRLSAMCSEGLQLIITTHSPHFVDLLGLEGLVLVTRESTAGTCATQVSIDELVNHCRRLGVPEARGRADSILPFYSAAGTREIIEGFFAKCIVLVEGPTEAMALPELLSKCGFECLQLGVAVIPVGGKGSLARWFRLFTAYDIPCFIIFDNDGSSDDPSGKHRRDALTAIGVTDQQQQDEILASDSWTCSERHFVFGLNFEDNLRSMAEEYERLEKKAREGGVLSKPLVARYVAERMPIGDAEKKFWRPFQAIADRLNSLLSSPAG